MTAILMIAAWALAAPVWGQNPIETPVAPSQAPNVQATQSVTPGARNPADVTTLAKAVGHQLAMNPWYGVFDWVDGQVTPEGVVVLRGQVVNPVTRTDAVAMVKRLKGVSAVKDEIEVLPVSTFDNRIRFEVYHSIYRYDTPLFLYSNRALPPIHIVVKNGNVTLKGYVGNTMDRQLAYTAAMTVPGVFGVTNRLKIG